MSWQLFWTIALLLSGAAFAVITVVVSILGYGDLKAMLTGLRRQAAEESRPRGGAP